MVLCGNFQLFRCQRSVFYNYYHFLIYCRVWFVFFACFFFVQTTRLWIHVCKVLMKSALCIQSVWSSSLSPPRCWCASCNSSDS